MSLTSLVQADKAAAQNAIADNTTQIAGIDDLVSSLTNQIATLVNQKTSLQTANTTLTDNLTKYDSIISALNGA